jgi:tight adherence protein B
MPFDALLWIAPLLYAVAFGGLGYMLLLALQAGSEAYAAEYTERTARQFEDIFLFIPTKRLLELAWALSAVCFLLAFYLFSDLSSERGIVIGIAVAALTALLALRLPSLLLRALRVRRRTRFNTQLVDALMTMSNALKAGFSITQAVESVVRNGEAPISQEFSVFLHETRVGVPFEEALNNMVERVGSDDLRLVAVSIETARLTGGNLTEVFESIAATIRERMRIEGRIRTLTAQGRLQGIVIGVMPILLCVAMVFVDPDMMMPFLHSRVGLIVLGAVAIFELLGFFFIRKIVRIDI